MAWSVSPSVRNANLDKILIFLHLRRVIDQQINSLLDESALTNCLQYLHGFMMLIRSPIVFHLTDRRKQLTRIENPHRRC